MVLMYFLSIRLGVLPVVTNTDLGQSIILPTLTLAISMAAKYTRQVRATVLEELNKDYVTGARARGIRSRVIIWKSVMKASMLTIITLLALSIGNLLGGTAIVENIFMWDGVGKLAVDAITMRDYPIIQAYVAWMAVIYVLVNLVTDIFTTIWIREYDLEVTEHEWKNISQSGNRRSGKIIQKQSFAFFLCSQHCFCL